MLESEIQKQILDWLSARGIWHRKVHVGAVKIKGGRARNPLSGFPDIFGILPGGLGRMFAIEVKAKKGRFSESQQDTIAVLERLGVLVLKPRSLEDVTERFNAYERFGA